MSQFLIFATLAIATMSAQDLEVDPSAPGTIVERNGYATHYIESGDVGAPAVLYFPGEGGVALEWKLVTDLVGKDARSIAFDPPGAGWSEFGQLDNSMAQQAFEYHAILEQQNIKGPYILVGQSKGGLVALTFAKMYPDKVDSVILVDSSHPDMMLRYRQQDGTQEWQKVRERAREREVPAPYSRTIDTSRETFSFARNDDVDPFYERYGEEAFARFAYLSGPKETVVPKALKDFFPEELRDMYADWPDGFHLGDHKLTILAATVRDPQGDETISREDLLAASDARKIDMLRLSHSSRLFHVAGASHHVHMDRPDFVAMVIRDHLQALTVN